jgi:hypothetical protein
MSSRVRELSGASILSFARGIQTRAIPEYTTNILQVNCFFLFQEQPDLQRNRHIHSRRFSIDSRHVPRHSLRSHSAFPQLPMAFARQAHERRSLFQVCKYPATRREGRREDLPSSRNGPIVAEAEKP